MGGILLQMLLVVQLVFFIAAGSTYKKLTPVETGVATKTNCL